MGSASPFSEPDLDANRSGVLSAEQRRHWRRYARRRRIGVLKAAGYIACVAVVLFAVRGSANRPGEFAAVCAGLGAVAVILALVAVLGGGGAWTLDARDGQVSIAEGPILKDPGDSDLPRQSVQVGALRLNVGQSGYDAAPDAGYVRVFYLPRTKWIVNLERLPDPPLPGGPDAIRQLMIDSAAALRSRDPNVVGAARASIAAVGEAVRAEFPANPAPPPAGQRDPRPLAQALCGTWSNIFMTLEFSADGTVTMTSGTVRTGRWSVDRGGRLVADLGFGQAAAQAWVSGAGLTILTPSGQAMGFTRVPPR